MSYLLDTHILLWWLFDKAKQLVENYAKILQDSQFVELAVTADHAIRAGSLPIDHRDPFDRMLMAQAEIENLLILTYDTAFKTGLIQTIPS